MRRGDRLARSAIAAAAVLTGAAAAAVAVFLVASAWPLLRSGEIVATLTGPWRSRAAAPEHGIAPMIAGTLALSAFALALALPAAIGVCACAHRVVPRPVARIAMACVRLMTGVPTVVYGFASVFLVVPFVRDTAGRGSGYSLLAAGLTLAVLVLPTIVLVLEARLASADPGLRATCAALGLTPEQAFTRVLLPASRSGLAAAAVLGFCRAAGDTLVALMVAGNSAQVPGSMLDSIRTLTSHVALVVSTDAFGPEYRSVATAGLALFVMTAGIAGVVRRRLDPLPGGARAHDG